MAAWCLATGQTPATWREAARYERAALEAEARRIAAALTKKRKRRR